MLFKFYTEVTQVIEKKIAPPKFKLTLHVILSKIILQGNRGDMRKIHVTRQFFEASGRYGDFFEKTKNPF